MITVGLDACPSGWACVLLADGRFGDAAVLPSAGAAAERWPDAAAYGVDIPIGLPARGPRRCDEAARTFVGARWASVWLTPTRARLEAPWAPGQGMSRQAHGMRSRIFEIETLRDPRFHEVHPEVVFAHLAQRQTVPPKRTWSGFWRRRALLAQADIIIPDTLDLEVPADDLLDAAAVAWSAGRIATGRSLTLPPDPKPGEPVICY
ncbi:MAG TPA: DUF429 domain-containing protein [Solirubrobacterales bacterium]|nr:DUF429 domain-containing protein [Solirubrobacterales bacterium]